MEHRWRLPPHGRHQPVRLHQDLHRLPATGSRHQRLDQNSAPSHCCLPVLTAMMSAWTHTFCLLAAAGRMVYMSSIFSFFNCLNMGAYSVSKRGLEAFADCLRVEMASFGVKVPRHRTRPQTNPVTLHEARLCEEACGKQILSSQTYSIQLKAFIQCKIDITLCRIKCFLVCRSMSGSSSCQSKWNSQTDRKQLMLIIV